MCDSEQGRTSAPARSINFLAFPVGVRKTKTVRSPLIRSRTPWAVFVLAIALRATGADTLSVLDFGAKGDGQTDDTAAFQKALNAAGQAAGGIVYAPRGNYRFAGHLTVPPAVTLKGVWESVPAHNGIRDAGLPKPTDDGTTFLVTENAGNEGGPPFLTLNHNSTLKGVVIYYPEQVVDAVPKPYPYAVAMRGKNPAVLAVEMLNPYNGIDASNNERHLIRDVHGQPLRRGIFVDVIYDIGRIENVHFNPWWTFGTTAYNWQLQHGEAFIFGKSDWQYVFNTFCYGYGVGYKFVETAAGHCNGNFLGIGGDNCHTALKVEQSSPVGLLITNGEFVSFLGPDPTMIQVTTNNTGTVRFVNSSFWGPCNQIAKIAGSGTVAFGDCTFFQWDRNGEGRHAIQAEGGGVMVRGCEFHEDKPQIELRAGVRRAVLTENLIRGMKRITNNSAGNVVVANNVSDEVADVIISQPPLPLTLVAGAAAEFAVTASGTGSLSYRWRRNGRPLPGPDTNRLVLPDIQPADAGTYDVVVTSALGSATGGPAALVVHVPPMLSLQAVGQQVSGGQTVTFTAAATGNPPPTYQWRLNGSPIAGATGPELNIPGATTEQVGAYSVVMSNAAGAITNTAGLSLLDLQRFAGVVIDAEPGGTFRVEYTTNINTPTTNWNALGTITPDRRPFYFFHPDSPGESKRFYRAVPLP